MSLMSSILRGFLGHFTSSVPSEQTRKYHQVRIPFKLILSLIEIIMGPCPPFAPTQLEIPSGFLLHNEYFFTFSSMDTVLCPYLCCCLQPRLIFNQYKTYTLSCEVLPLSVSLIYLEEGTEIRGRTSHLTLSLFSHSCLETLAMCPAKCIFLPLPFYLFFSFFCVSSKSTQRNKNRFLKCLFCYFYKVL